MDSALVVVTLISLSAAGVLAGLVWRLQRDEQRRSAARVAALAADVEDVNREDAPAVATGGTLFTDIQDPAEGTTPPRVLFAILGGFVMIAVAAGAMLAAGSGRTPAARTQAVPPPLELLSLRHTVEGDRLAVAGLVRNPAGAGDTRGLVALALAFDRDGTFVASGRAPLELTVLGPGEASPFTVSVPAGAGAGRYRVSFRDADGRTVPHVDRRGASAAVSLSPLGLER